MTAQEGSRATRLTVTFTGKDQPKIASEVIAAAALANAKLVDVRQSVVQKRITLVLELEFFSEKEGETALFKSLLSAAGAFRLSTDFDIADQQLPSHQLQALHLRSTQDTPGANGAEIAVARKPGNAASKTFYVLTLLSRTSISPTFLGKMASLLAERSVTTERMTRLSERELRCLELVVGTAETLSPSDVGELRKELYAFGKTSCIDVALQAESVLRRSKRLVVMDMDSTLIQQEVIDEIARHAGVYEKVCEITHRAMAGKLDFNQSLAARVALLKGTPATVFDKVIGNLQYTPGAKTLCRTLKRLGYRLAVISGGFTRVTSHVRNELGLDYDYANQLEEAGGVFTGRTVGPVVNAQRKADLLMTIAQQERITLDQVIAIGDGANDLPMLGTAGLGIAFNAKPAVQEAARFRINQPSLVTVLYLLGFSERDQEELNGGTDSIASAGSM